MPSTPKEYETKIKSIAQAWETLRPAKSFGGHTRAQFKAKVQACTDARNELDSLEKQRTSAQDRRDEAATEAFEAAQLIVNAVKRATGRKATTVNSTRRWDLCRAGSARAGCTAARVEPKLNF